MYEICISISSKPGNFGTTIHNAGYKKLNLKYIYKALKVTNLNQIINSIKIIDIKGCSVSMPFKTQIISYLNTYEKSVKECGACNTVLNKNGKLIGFNTDVSAISKLFKKQKIKKEKKILVIGSGGVARAYIFSLLELGYKNIHLVARNSGKMKILEKDFGITTNSINSKARIKSDVLINATPIGMKNNVNDFKIIKKYLDKQILVIDSVVTYKPTKIIDYCKKYKIQYIDGFSISFEQACQQFKIYTGKNPPINSMKKVALSLKK